MLIAFPDQNVQSLRDSNNVLYLLMLCRHFIPTYSHCKYLYNGAVGYYLSL